MHRSRDINVLYRNIPYFVIDFDKKRVPTPILIDYLPLAGIFNIEIPEHAEGKRAVIIPASNNLNYRSTGGIVRGLNRSVNVRINSREKFSTAKAIRKYNSRSLLSCQCVTCSRISSYNELGS